MDRESRAYPVIPVIKRIDDDADYHIIFHLHRKKGIHYFMPFFPLKSEKGGREKGGRTYFNCVSVASPLPLNQW
jgi:hypothetical protein